MARFINTGAQNKANMEDMRCNQAIFCTYRRNERKAVALRNILQDVNQSIGPFAHLY